VEQSATIRRASLHEEGPALVRTMLPEMARVGVTTAAEVDVETLAERLQREVAAGGGIVTRRSEVGAWSRV
jgi:hypothetical protein